MRDVEVTSPDLSGSASSLRGSPSSKTRFEGFVVVSMSSSWASIAVRDGELVVHGGDYGSRVPHLADQNWGNPEGHI
jgi:hypothetical protein